MPIVSCGRIRTDLLVPARNILAIAYCQTSSKYAHRDLPVLYFQGNRVLDTASFGELGRGARHALAYHIHIRTYNRARQTVLFCRMA